MHQKNIVTAGRELNPGGKVLVMLHGRGGSAEDILSLATELNVKEFALMAPQAINNSWYPYSFMSPPSQNEPWLSSALELLKELVDDLNGKGIPSENIYFTGFSQGACLTLEFVTRHAKKYGA
jgi:phospholipase/carboxylesterase